MQFTRGHLTFDGVNLAPFEDDDWRCRQLASNFVIEDEGERNEGEGDRNEGAGDNCRTPFPPFPPFPLSPPFFELSAPNLKLALLGDSLPVARAVALAVAAATASAAAASWSSAAHASSTARSEVFKVFKTLRGEGKARCYVLESAEDNEEKSLPGLKYFRCS
jgi:hypothetical protein